MERSHSARMERSLDGAADLDPATTAGRFRSRKWNYATGIKFYHQHSKPPMELSDLLVNELAAGAVFPGGACQAAREMLGLTQQDLATTAQVSRKTINDFENVKTEPGGRILRALRETLEAQGARFCVLGGAVGVYVGRPCAVDGA